MDPMKLLSASLLALFLLNCGGSSPAGPQVPVLVVGVDGLEWSVLEPLMAAGRAPNFQRLAERGVAGALRTQTPTFSPVVWTTIATGVDWQEHGILNFAEVVRGERGPEFGRPYTSNCRRVPAIWNIAGDHGRDVLSVGWWVSWPAEPVENGRIVASYAAQVQGGILWKAGVWRDGLPELTFPDSLQEQLRPLLEAGEPDGPLRTEYEEIFGVLPDEPEWMFAGDRDRLFRVSYHGDRTHQRIMRHLLEEEVADLNLVYFGLPDVAGHFFWRYHEPGAFGYQEPAEHVERLRGRLSKSYQVVDDWLGELLAAVPEDAHVLVLSDHGLHAANVEDRAAIQSGAHEDAPDGVLFLSGPGVERRGLLPPPDRRVADVLSITPTLLDLLGLPQAADLPGAPLRELMTEEWRASHPPAERRSYRRGFRRASEPRVPAENVNEEFLRGLRELGYLGGS
jgi:hypothetical protein